jgi:hypothetical protein
MLSSQMLHLQHTFDLFFLSFNSEQAILSVALTSHGLCSVGSHETLASIINSSAHQVVSFRTKGTERVEFDGQEGPIVLSALAFVVTQVLAGRLSLPVPSDAIPSPRCS